MEITPEQIRAARALLRLEQAELAARAGISVVTIRRIEGSAGNARVAPATLDGVRQVLEQAGAEFIPDGVRLRPFPPRHENIFDDLRAISLRSEQRLAGREVMTDADLYNENGLPH
jgi:transcriptional regulator with XRE-family HTH domain